MAAYFVCTMSVHDPETYRKYTALTPATLARHGGKFLTRGDTVETVEGPTFSERLVLIEFPDREAALAVFRKFRELQELGARIMFGHDPDFWKSIPQAPVRLG